MAAVSFSKVTDADLELSASSEVGVTEMDWILPLGVVSIKIIKQDVAVSLPEAEEVSNFLLTGLGGNILDVDGGRHV